MPPASPHQSFRSPWAVRLTLLFLPFVSPLPADADVPQPLLSAVYHDDIESAKRLLADGADASEANRYGVTPLTLACQNGNTELVEALLMAGADPNTTQPGGETALMTAARTGMPGPVKALLAVGAEIDARERSQQTALMWAAAEGHAEVIELLLAAGADPKIRLQSGYDALLFAVREGRIDALKALLATGLDVNAATENERSGGRGLPTGSSPLTVAVENGHFDLATVLLEAGAGPNDQRSGFTPLHILTWVRKPNRGDGDDGMPPPIGSGTMTSLEFVKVLVEHGADVNARLERGPSGGGQLGMPGATPFLLASKTADLPFLKLLLELNADLLLPNHEGVTPLMAAAGVGTRFPTEEAGTEEEALAVVEFLLGLGGDLNTVSKNGETAMHGAAYKSLPAMVRFLAQKGADVSVWNQKNKSGWTPLIIAQGFRPGNFKPAPETIEALSEVLRASGIEPPPAPERKEPGAPKAYP
jgi:ankyrin repeat protein